MPVRIVQSKHNTRLKELRRALARPGRGPHGLAGVEGPHLVEEALRTGLRVPTIFCTEETLALVEGWSPPASTEILLLPAALLAAELDTETPQAVAALVEIPAWTMADVLGSQPGSSPTTGPGASALVVVLAGVQDPGNLGTILRSAEAFGATGAICLPGTVSAWNSKAVRASSGSVFILPLVSASADECYQQLTEAGARIFATEVDGASPVHTIDLTGPVALVVGNEGSGVPADLLQRASGRITIPCPGPVESLNVGVAAGILLYEAARQRSTAANRIAVSQRTSR